MPMPTLHLFRRSLQLHVSPVLFTFPLCSQNSFPELYTQLFEMEDSLIFSNDMQIMATYRKSIMYGVLVMLGRKNGRNERYKLVCVLLLLPASTDTLMSWHTVWRRVSNCVTLAISTCAVSPCQLASSIALYITPSFILSLLYTEYTCFCFVRFSVQTVVIY